MAKVRASRKAENGQKQTFAEGVAQYLGPNWVDLSMIEPRRIISDRNAGYMRLAYVSHWNETLSEAVDRFGLHRHQELIRVERPKAAAIVEALLSRDMAYKQRLKAADSAAMYTDSLLADFPETESTFYTNASWDEFFESSSFSYSALVGSATFDGGVIAVTEGLALCIWFEDED